MRVSADFIIGIAGAKLRSEFASADFAAFLAVCAHSVVNPAEPAGGSHGRRGTRHPVAADSRIIAPRSGSIIRPFPSNKAQLGRNPAPSYNALLGQSRFWLRTGIAYNDSGSTVSAMGCDVKDYDNDGFVDVFYNNLMGQDWALFQSMKGKSFRYVSPVTHIAQLSKPLSGWSNAFIDYDNDGWKDLYSSNGEVDNPGGTVRVRGMDTGQSSAAFKLHRAQGRPGCS